MTPLSKLLFDIYKDSQTLKSIQSIGKIQAAWQSVIPHPLSENAYPTHYANGILVVQVSSPVWAQKMRFQQMEIISKLQKLPEMKQLSSLKIRPQTNTSTVNRQLTKHPASRPSPQTARLLNQVADGLHDEKLQSSLRRIAKHAKSRED